MMRGVVFTVFLKHGQQHIGTVPYTQDGFASRRIYDWDAARHHKVNGKRKLRPNTADLYKMANFLDRGARPYRRHVDAVAQLEEWINQPVMAGEKAA